MLISILVDGEPPPEVRWLLNGAPFQTDSNLAIENIDYMSRFLLQKATRKLNGTYKIIATNSSGTDEAEVILTVKGKPSKPIGPLEVSEVFEDRCTLDWKPPEDDGGEPIDYVIFRKIQDYCIFHNFFSMKSKKWILLLAYGCQLVDQKIHTLK